MIVVEFQKLHFVLTVRADQRIIPKGCENRSSPLIKAAKKSMLVFGNGPMKTFV